MKKVTVWVIVAGLLAGCGQTPPGGIPVDTDSGAPATFRHAYATAVRAEVTPSGGRATAACWSDDALLVGGCVGNSAGVWESQERPIGGGLSAGWTCWGSGSDGQAGELIAVAWCFGVGKPAEVL